MSRPDDQWGKEHRIVYLLLGCVATKGEPSEQGVMAVGEYVAELMNLGVLEMDDKAFDGMWSEVWLQQRDDRRGGFRSLMERALHHAGVLRGEIDHLTAQSLVALGLMRIARAEGNPTPEQMGFIMGCGQMLGVG